MIVGWLQLIIFLALALVVFGVCLWAFVDAMRRPPAAFTYAGKRTKGFWLAVTGGATAVAFVGIPPPLGLGLIPIFLSLIAAVAGGVYLADVRPAVRGYRPGSSSW